MMRKTGHRLVFHHAIIHENVFTAVKNLSRPLHLRMLCPKSGSFCNKRAFMWLFMKPVSYRAEGHHGHSARAALPLTPTDVFALYLLSSARFRQRFAWDGPPAHVLPFPLPLLGPLSPRSPVHLLESLMHCLCAYHLGGDRLETLVHAPRRWPTRRRACVERRTCRYLHLASTALPGIRPSRSG